MGLFDGLFKKEEIIIGSPFRGRCVSIKEVSDPTFGEEILGKGVAVIPVSGTVYAPADGTVTTVFPTGHAVAITTEEGAEILVHVGLDTVKLDGRHFEIQVSQDQKVKKGDVLVQVDLDKVKEEGFDIITPIIVCNSDEYSEITGLTGQEVEPGAAVMKIKK